MANVTTPLVSLQDTKLNLGSGSLGIGVNPGTILHVKGSDPVFTIEDTSAPGTARIQCLNGSLILQSDVSAGVANSIISFKIDDTEYARFNSGGNLGIGTISPSSLLHLYGASGATGEIRLESSNGKAFTIGSTGTAYGSANNLIIYDIGASAERLRVDTNGNVGIGTTSPDTKLDIGAGSIRLDAGYNLEWGSGYAGGNPAIWGDGTAAKLRFAPTGNSGGIVMELTDTNSYIDSNLGIGTTSPEGKLHVFSASAGTVTASSVADELVIEGSGDSGLTILSPDNKESNIFLGGPGLSYGGLLRWKHSDLKLTLGTNVSNSFIAFNTGAGTERVRIAANGNVGIGNTNPDKLFVVQGADAEIAINDTNGTPQVRFRENGVTSALIEADTDLLFKVTDEKMRITSAGNVGIGTTSPGRHLSVTDLGQIKLTNNSTGNWAGLDLLTSGGTNNYTAYFGMLDSNGNFFIDVGSNGDDVIIRQNGETNIGLQGKVLVGRTTALNTGSKLHVDNAIALGSSLYTFSQIIGGADLQLISNANPANLGVNSNIIFKLGTSGGGGPNEKMRISSDGNVGIGTTSPASLLHVFTGAPDFGVGAIIQHDTSSAGRFATLSFGAGSYRKAAIAIESSGDTNGTGDLVFAVDSNNDAANVASGDEKMRIQSDGNVGIGYTSPTEKLFVKNGSINTTIARFTGANNDRGLVIGTAVSGITNDSIIEYDAVSTNSVGQHAFKTDGTERVRIDENGNVGIGTTSPNSAIHIIKAITGDSSQLRIGNDNGAELRLGITGTGANEAAHIKTNSGENLEFQIGQAANATSPSVVFKSGGGIQFGAYGVGTFTGTTAKVLAVDSSGNIIETNAGSGTVTSSAATTNYVAKWTNGGSEILGNSVIYDNGTNVGIGTTSPAFSNGSGLEIEKSGIATLRVQSAGSHASEIFQSTSALNIADLSSGTMIFQISNAEKMRLNSTGLGIGTTSPSQALNIARSDASGSAEFDLYSTNSAKQPMLTFRKSASNTIGTKSVTPSGGELGEIEFIGVNTGSNFAVKSASIIGLQDGAAGATYIPGALTFGTGTNSAAVSERMRIDSSGSVGIGTTSPATKLDIFGEQYNSNYPTMLRVIDNVTAFDTDNNGGGISFGGRHTSGGVLGFLAGIQGVKENNTSGNYNGALRFLIRENGTSLLTEKMRITSAGNVGIGTTNPDGKLHIYEGSLKFTTATNATIANISFVRESTSNGMVIQGFETYIAFNTFGGGAGEIMRLNRADGNVGIGTTSPDSKFHVVNNDFVLFENTTASANSLLKLKTASRTWQMSVREADLSGALTFRNETAGTDDLVIKTDGNVGIGTTSPSAPLEIAGAASATDTGITIKNGSATRLRLFHNDNAGASYLTSYDGVGAAQALNIRSGNKLYMSGGGGSTHVTVDTSGNVGIGTTSPESILEIAANNPVINFKDTSAGTDLSYRYIQNVDGKMLFAKANDAYNSFTTHMAITTDGSVGIGTASPSYKLHVNGGGARIEDGETTLSPDSTGSSGTSSRALTIMNLVDSGWTTDALTAYNNTTSYDILNRASYSFFARPKSTNIFTHCTEVNDNAHLYRFVNLNSSATEPLLRWAFYQYDGSGTASSDFKVANQLFEIQHSGNTQLMVQGDGNVGIGTSTPDYKLDVEGGLRVYQNTSAVGAGTGLTVENDGTGDAVVQYLLTATRRWVTGIDNSDSDKFKIATNLDLGVDTYLTIQTDGNVGIGTASPSQKLHVVGKALITDDVQLTGSNPRIDFNSNGASSLRFYDTTNAAERMRIDTSGNVGIGTTSPTQKLQVRGEQVYLYNDIDTNNTYFYARNSSSGNAGIKMKNSQGEWTIIANDRLRFYDDDNSVERLSILSSGNVGIGTTSPARKLHVVESSVAEVARLQSASSTGGSWLGFHNSSYDLGYFGWGTTSNNNLYIVNYQNAATLFYTNGTEKVRIAAAGNVGIGTTSPSVKLEVKDSQDSSLVSGIGIIRSASSQTGYINMVGGAFNFNAPSAIPIKFRDGGTANMTILGDGNVGIGTESPTQKLEVTGNIRVMPSSGDAIIRLTDQGVRNWDLRVSDGSDYFEIDGTTSISLAIKGDGNVGIGTITPGYKLEVNGDFAATSKSFVIDHPTKPNKKLRYASLEGPENGVYVRGRGDSDVIELPDYWTGLVHDDSITVQITAIGKDSEGKVRTYSVNDIVDNKVYIYTDSKDTVYNYFYIVNGERKDIDKLEVEIDK